MANKGTKPGGAKSKAAGKTQKTRGGKITASIVRRLELSTVPKARETWSRLVREYDRGELSSERFRDFATGFRVLHTYLSSEREEQLNVRLAALELRVSELLQTKEKGA